MKKLLKKFWNFVKFKKNNHPNKDSFINFSFFSKNIIPMIIISKGIIINKNNSFSNKIIEKYIDYDEKKFCQNLIYINHQNLNKEESPDFINKNFYEIILIIYSKNIKSTQILFNFLDIDEYMILINNDYEQEISICQFFSVKYDLSFSTDYFHSQKMNAIGYLAGGIAHDFNNLLTAILGFSEILLSKHSIDHPSFPEIIQIKQNSIRASNLISQLLAFSRKQVLKPSILKLNNILFNITDLLKRLIGERIFLDLSLDYNIENIFFDQCQFEQIIINLVINSRDAINKIINNKFSQFLKPSIKIKSSIIHINKNQNFFKNFNFKYNDYFLPEKIQSIDDGEYILLEINDNGVGINKNIYDKIFEPFFSTKKNENGTGLGLSTVYGIIKQSSAHIFISSSISTDNHGTSFYILLKHINENESNEIMKNLNSNQIQEDKYNIFQESNNTSLIKNNIKANIMIVEDEDSIRELIKITLAKHRLFDMKNPVDALNFFKDELFEKIDLLITDVLMPNLNGYELAAEIIKYLPNIKIIFISGYCEEEFNHKTYSFNKNNIVFISKPFNLKKINLMVEKLLNIN